VWTVVGVLVLQRWCCRRAGAGECSVRAGDVSTRGAHGAVVCPPADMRWPALDVHPPCPPHRRQTPRTDSPAAPRPCRETPLGGPRRADDDGIPVGLPGRSVLGWRWDSGGGWKPRRWWGNSSVLSSETSGHIPGKSRGFCWVNPVKNRLQTLSSSSFLLH